MDGSQQVLTLLPNRLLFRNLSTCDAASRPEASYIDNPVNNIEPVGDTASLLAGLLRDEICKRKRSLPMDVVQILHECAEDATAQALRIGMGQEDKSAMKSLAEILHAFTVAPDSRVLAYCYLLIINKTNYSETEIARICGVTKAAVSKTKIELQDRLTLTPRVGRTPEARETFRQICLKRGKKKREISWMGLNLFLNPARLLNAA